MSLLKTNRLLVYLLIASLAAALVSFAGLATTGRALSAAKAAAAYPAEGMLASVREMVRTGQSVEAMQAAIDAGVTPEIVSFLVVGPDGIVLAAHPKTAVGANPGVISIRRTVNMVPLPLAPYHQSRPADSFPRLLFQGNDLDDAGVNLLYDNVTTVDGRGYLLASTWADDSSATAALRARLNLFDGLFRLSFILYWVLLAAWVYRDARDRGGNGLAWGILTLLTNAIGWSVYLVARPRPVICPACRRTQDAAYRVCPDCGYHLQAVCRECGTRIEPRWSYCAHCGAKLKEE